MSPLTSGGMHSALYTERSDRYGCHLIPFFSDPTVHSALVQALA